MVIIQRDVVNKALVFHLWHRASSRHKVKLCLLVYHSDWAAAFLVWLQLSRNLSTAIYFWTGSDLNKPGEEQCHGHFRHVARRAQKRSLRIAKVIHQIGFSGMAIVLLADFRLHTEEERENVCVPKSGDFHLVGAQKKRDTCLKYDAKKDML